MAPAKRLIVSVNTLSVLPYLYFDAKQGIYAGLVVDLLSSFEDRSKIAIEYMAASAHRSEHDLITGTADLYLSNLNWLQQPEKLIATKPLVPHASYLYSTRPFAEDFALDHLHQVRICTLKRYVYSGLAPYFERGEFERVNGPSHISSATMLARGRCDFAVFNNFNAAVAFSDPNLCEAEIYQSPQPTSVMALALVMRADEHWLKPLLDEHIEAFRANGQLQASMKRHSPRLTFPKTHSCVPAG